MFRLKIFWSKQGGTSEAILPLAGKLLLQYIELFVRTIPPESTGYPKNVKLFE